ncbi:biotin-dependent carboxyltransferase family protein [Metabacillus endolithicus]|uniref:5-oxoprolinase subunit C family protein n=1 Tax=Metabacillus endolithicus TaxID=1535204 RepID=UPI001FF8D823|nr:biotin-dependent carboxyltransferase family protein [Metabacillus endolithicus]UPG65675.1 biotin-dependent carboxyltransferase family protein [Metabacillus endolithicus]
MSITTLRSGLLTTIQDLGRYGYQKYGVIVSGAMDSYSLRIANLLVGNSKEEAALEITLMGPTLLVEKDMLIAITGGDLSPTIEGVSVPLWRPVFVKKGSKLQFGAQKSGCRTYLAVAGGFAVQRMMKSKSTYLRAEIGGYQGRAIQEGDVLETNPISEGAFSQIEKLKNKQYKGAFLTTNWSVRWNEFLPLTKNPNIRVLPGAQFEQFTANSKQQFFTQSFRVSPQSDRMGYRLSGPSIELEEKLEMLSEAVAHGTIQIPPDGNPIILLADRQTTGGYPKIGQVATVDLPVVAQVMPGQSLSFTEITLEKAERLYLEREKSLKQLAVSINYKLKQ